MLIVYILCVQEVLTQFNVNFYLLNKMGQDFLDRQFISGICVVGFVVTSEITFVLLLAEIVLNCIISLATTSLCSSLFQHPLLAGSTFLHASYSCLFIWVFNVSAEKVTKVHQLKEDLHNIYVPDESFMKGHFYEGSYH